MYRYLAGRSERYTAWPPSGCKATSVVAGAFQTIPPEVVTASDLSSCTSPRASSREPSLRPVQARSVAPGDGMGLESVPLALGRMDLESVPEGVTDCKSVLLGVTDCKSVSTGSDGLQIHPTGSHGLQIRLTIVAAGEQGLKITAVARLISMVCTSPDKGPHADAAVLDRQDAAAELVAVGKQQPVRLAGGRGDAVDQQVTGKPVRRGVRLRRRRREDRPGHSVQRERDLAEEARPADEIPLGHGRFGHHEPAVGQDHQRLPAAGGPVAPANERRGGDRAAAGWSLEGELPLGVDRAQAARKGGPSTGMASGGAAGGSGSAAARQEGKMKNAK